MDNVLLDDAGIAKALLIDKKVLEFSGKIDTAYFDGWSLITLEQKNGYKINLATRLDEATSNYGNGISVCYWICDERKTAEQLIEYNMLAADGYFDFELEKHDIVYSEYTQDTDYDVTLKVGGHDLYKELSSKVGSYLYMMVEWR